MDTIVKYAPDMAIVLVALGLLGYGVALALAAFGSGSLSTRLHAWFTLAPAQNIGIPCAAISAFAVVAVLLRAFPVARDAGDALALNAFGLEFSGPSGPITLWLMCFLGFVIALKMLRV
jgi:hypothetical protein